MPIQPQNNVILSNPLHGTKEWIFYIEMHECELNTHRRQKMAHSKSCYKENEKQKSRFVKDIHLVWISLYLDTSIKNDKSINRT